MQKLTICYICCLINDTLYTIYVLRYRDRLKHLCDCQLKATANGKTIFSARFAASGAYEKCQQPRFVIAFVFSFFFCVFAFAFVFSSIFFLQFLLLPFLFAFFFFDCCERVFSCLFHSYLNCAPPLRPRPLLLLIAVSLNLRISLALGPGRQPLGFQNFCILFDPTIAEP